MRATGLRAGLDGRATLLFSAFAVAISAVAMIVAITRHTNPGAAELKQFAFPPQLNSVRLGETPAQLRRQLGPPVAVHRIAVPPILPAEPCWDYLFPTSTPRYRLCFLNGRLATRTPF